MSQRTPETTENCLFWIY